MSILLAIVGVPVALVLPGLATLVAFFPRRRPGATPVGAAQRFAESASLLLSRSAEAPRDGYHLDWLEWLYLALALSLVLSGWVGLVLAQIGIFSAGLLVGLLALYTVVVGFVGWRRGRWGELVGARHFRDRVTDPGTQQRSKKVGLAQWMRGNASPLLYVLLSLIFIVLAFRPFELILGPRDAAVYPATAAQIARHGGIRIADPILATLPDPALSDENNRLWTSLILLQSAGRFYYHYLRMPGFFIAEADVDREVAIPEFIPDVEGEVVVPQFYFLYPTWLAVAFGLVGIKTGLLMTPYLSFLGGVGVFLLARRLFGAPTALLAALFLNLNVLQVWFARYSTAEGATQFLLFFCLYAFARLEEDEGSRGEPFWGLLVGLPLGMLGLVRVEFIFPWLLFLPYLAYLYVTRGLRRGHRALLLAFGLLVVHTVVQFVFYTRAYTLAIYYHEPIQKSFVLSWLVYPFMTPTLRLYFYESATSRTHIMKEPWRLFYELGVPLLVAAALVLLRHRPAWVQRIGAWLRRHGRLLLTAAAVLVALALAYTYLVRPGILTPEVLLHPVENGLTLQGYIGAPVPTGRAANLVRLGWYLSPLGMVLAFAGISLLVARESNRRAWFLILLGVFYLALFTYETFGMDHHIYIMRRYVAMVLPFFCIAAAYALAWLGEAVNHKATRTPRQLPPRHQDTKKKRNRCVFVSLWFDNFTLSLRGDPFGFVRRGVAVLLAAGMVVYLVYTGLPFFRHNEYAGALDQVATLAERFEPEDVILAVGAGRDAPFTIVTPLRYLFERNAFGVVSDPPASAQLGEQIQRWQTEGRHVYLLVGNGGGRLFLPHMRLQWLGRFELAVPEFEQLTAQKPHNAYILRQPWGIYEPVPWTGAGSALADLPLEIDLGSDGYIFQTDGFYGDETDADGTTYCWTWGQGVLRLPWPQEGVVTIALRLAGGKRPAALGPAEAEAWVEDQRLGAWTLNEGFTTQTLVVPAEAITPDENGTVVLSIVSPVWKQVDYGLGSDARSLGVEVDWVRVGRGER